MVTDFAEALSIAGLQLSPAPSSVVGDDLLEHGLECGGVDLLTLTNGDGASGLVVVTAGDDPLKIGHDRAVVQEDIHPGFRREDRADVSFQREVGLARAL